MDDFFTAAVKHFSFTEMLCFYLLWRVENKLAAVSDAINNLIINFEHHRSQGGS